MAMRELKMEKAAEVDTLATNPIEDDFIHFPGYYFFNLDF